MRHTDIRKSFTETNKATIPNYARVHQHEGKRRGGEGQRRLESVLRILVMKSGDKSGLMNYNVLFYHYAFYLGIVMQCKITLS